MTARLTHAAAALISLALLTATPAAAFENKAYDAATLAAEQKAGKAVLVHVTAPWCSTCKAQKQALEQMSDDPAFEDVVVLSLDFDNGGDALQDLKASSQSTLIAYKGETETGRSVGDSNADNISALIKSAL